MTAVIWEEICLKWDLTLPPSTIVQAWRREPASLASIVIKGYRALFGSCTHWYLDCGYGGWLEPDPKNPNTTVKPPLLGLVQSIQELAADTFLMILWQTFPKKTGIWWLGDEAHLWGGLDGQRDAGWHAVAESCGGRGVGWGGVGARCVRSLRAGWRR